MICIPKTISTICVILLLGPSSAGADCEDLVDFCDTLSPICAGSIIQYHFKQLETVANQIENSTSIPALEESLPAVQSVLPLVGATSDDTNKIVTTSVSIEKSLPLLKESLPLIRESLPLIRESLPLIRQFINPLYNPNDKTTCQKKATCKSCRECPQLRDDILSLVESLCPQTCKTCETAKPASSVAASLVDYYV